MKLPSQKNNKRDFNHLCRADADRQERKFQPCPVAGLLPAKGCQQQENKTGVEGRDPINDIRMIQKELSAYNEALAGRPQVIAANKIDALYEGENDDAIQLLREEFEPEGMKVFPISAVSGKGVRELLYYVNNLLKEVGEEKITFEREYFPEQMEENLPFSVFKSEEEEDVYHVEGPRIERMLGYTNLESEKGFDFFQKFMKENGILDELEALGIQDGDTVKVYYHEFEYYK